MITLEEPPGDAETPHGDGADAKNIRIRICEKIVHYITPIVAAWGVNINAFQLESTTLANPQVCAALCVCLCVSVCLPVYLFVCILSVCLCLLVCLFVSVSVWRVRV